VGGPNVCMCVCVCVHVPVQMCEGALLGWDDKG